MEAAAVSDYQHLIPPPLEHGEEDNPQDEAEDVPEAESPGMDLGAEEDKTVLYPSKKDEPKEVLFVVCLDFSCHDWSEDSLCQSQFSSHG